MLIAALLPFINNYFVFTVWRKPGIQYNPQMIRLIIMYTLVSCPYRQRGQLNEQMNLHESESQSSTVDGCTSAHTIQRSRENEATLKVP